MTIQELEDRIVSVMPHGYGTYKVTIKYRNKNHSCLSHNSSAYDTYWQYRKELYPCNPHAFKGSDNEYTYKQAMQALYNECKRHNDI